MPFFKRILKYDQKTVVQQEKRYASRFNVSPKSPLKVSLAFDYLKLEGTVVNLSTLGAAVILHKEFACPRNTPCKITFILDNYKLQLNATISHHRLTPEGKRFGLKLELEDFEARLSFLQLIAPLHIGASLIPSKRQTTASSEPGVITKKYHATNDTVLTVWRNYIGHAITGFEFRIADYFVRNGKNPPELILYTQEEKDQSDNLGYQAPVLKRAKKEHGEIQQLFNWIVPHLNDNVPDDVCSYLKLYCTRAKRCSS